jgi:hypothetical protein
MLGILVGGLIAVVAVAAPTVVGARSSTRTARRGAKGCGATVKVVDNVKYEINRYFQDGMRFDPGTVTLKSGCDLTFTFASPGQDDPHSLSIVSKVCVQIGAKHVAHPGQPPGPKNPIAHWIVNVGKPGLDAPGDSIGIFEARGSPPGHKRVTIPVSAPAGTTLYFICGLHSWMQGKIVVK